MPHLGLVYAARQIEGYGRGPDKQLAHISPDESEFMDYLQGGRRENPVTGLPEYSAFGKILKSVARIAAATGAFVISGGNPLAAAAASGAVTKLTGGSWKDSLKAAAITGVTAGIGNAATGPSMWSSSALKGAAGAGSGAASGAAQVGLSDATKQGIAQATTQNAGFSAAVNAGVPLAEAANPGTMALFASEAGNNFGQQAAQSGLASLSPSLGASAHEVAHAAMAYAPMTADDAIMQASTQAPTQTALQSALADIGGRTGAMTGLSALAVPTSQHNPYDPGPQGPPPGFGGNFNFNVAPQPRVYRPYIGDMTKYGERGGGWEFFDNVNPKPQFLADGGRVRYALGGGVNGPGDPDNGLGGLGALRMPGVPNNLQTPMIGQPQQQFSTSPAAQRNDMRRAAIIGYLNARSGGAIHGPGGPEEDAVPAMLSDNENVWDAQTVKLAGKGSYDRGHKVMQRMKHDIRKKAGMKNPSKPPAFGGA